MAPRCFQTLDNGQRCDAPAIYSSKYCRHHDPQRTPKPLDEKSGDTEPLILPALIDKPSILAAVNEVVHALAEGRIKRSVADTLLSAIKLANRLLTEIAEAGLSVYPTRQETLRTNQTAVPRNDRNGALALAASSDPRKGTGAHDPAHLNSSAYSTNVDPSTARIVRELVARSHELARTQASNR